MILTAGSHPIVWVCNQAVCDLFTKLYCLFAAVVSNLFVLPSHRGAGIGAELLRTALQHSTYTKLRAVELEVDSVEENARKLCEGQDWVLEVMSPKALFRILRLDKYLYRRACTVWPQTEILE